MAKKRYVKVEQGRYNVALSRDLAAYEARRTGESCLYCGDYHPNARKQGSLSFVCKDCTQRNLCR